MSMMDVREEWMNRLIDMGVDVNPKKLLKWASENPEIVAKINRDFINVTREEDDDERRDDPEELGAGFQCSQGRRLYRDRRSYFS